MEDLMREILKNFKDALLGGAGGLVAYLYHYSNARDKDAEVKMDWVVFVINGIVGAFMAYSLGGFIPHTLEFRDGLIGMVGVTGFGLMGAIESKFVNNFISKFMKD